ncbi:hypothetical protein rpr22_CDS648 [Rickettsia prowazekii str. Rp22]|uniref:Uncharacterized protein n=1 Tax=Rickettsia prowazekii (strain Rp22) TaxID=449216 RepID=D5AXS5_RICPP|nr:hypothetical protein rpr22_CDS648 [Rickettsia prowazekii str. Rp22]
MQNYLTLRYLSINMSITCNRKYYFLNLIYHIITNLSLFKLII